MELDSAVGLRLIVERLALAGSHRRSLRLCGLVDRQSAIRNDAQPD